MIEICPSLFWPQSLDFLPLLLYFSYNEASKGKLAIALGSKDLVTHFGHTRRTGHTILLKAGISGSHLSLPVRFGRVSVLISVLHLCPNFKILTSLLIYPLRRCLDTKCPDLGLK